MISGNINALMQVKVPGSKNSIGELITEWLQIKELFGFLDLMGGDSKYSTYSAKIQESTHIFICDYTNLTVNVGLEQIEITSENSRMQINGKLYDILLIDDPMELHQHLEIYLKYAGGQ